MYFYSYLGTSSPSNYDRGLKKITYEKCNTFLFTCFHFHRNGARRGVKN